MFIDIRQLLIILIAVAAMVFTASAALSADSLILDEIQVEGAAMSANEDNLTVREVRESSAKDIGEALGKVEGIDFIRKGAIANDVVLRGFQKDNINVLVDGVRLYGGCPNRMDPPAFHVDFAEVDRIAVIKGPFDITSPGGMGGQVDIITKSASPGFGADAGVTAGSFGSVNLFGTAYYGGENADILGGYSFKYSRTPRSGDGKRITDIYPSTNMNRYIPSNINTTAYQINSAWTKVGVNTFPGSRMEVSYSYQDASHVLTPYLSMDAMEDTTNRVNWTYNIKKDSGTLRALKTQFFWDNVDHTMDNSLRMLSVGTPLGYSMKTDTKSEVYGAKLAGDIALGGGTLGVGADYYHRSWLANSTMYMMMMSMWSATEQPLIPDVSLQNAGVFTKYDRRLTDTLDVSAGIRGDVAWASAAGLSDSRLADTYQPYYSFTLKKDVDFGEVSGNVQLFYRPTDEVQLFIGAGRAVRMPDPSELYIGLRKMSGTNFIGNPGLKPTKNHEVDLGGGYYAERYYIKATAFYSYLDDYINITPLADPDGGGPLNAAKSYENVDAWMAGGELGSQLALPLNLYLNGSLSYTYARNETNGTPLSEIPPLKGMAGIRYDDGMFIAEVFENMAAPQRRVDPALNEGKTAGWATTNFKAGVSYNSMTFFAGVDNILDKQYYTHLSYQRDPFSTGVKVPETGRSFYVMLTYRR
jgi:iron complex outermembrane recepter protein